MRIPAGIGLALLVLPRLVGAADLSTIRQVVIYPDRARIQRVKEVPCGERQVVPFAAIPPSAEPASVRASISPPSAATVDGLRVEEESRQEAFGQRQRTLQKEITAQSQKLEGLRNAQTVSLDGATLATVYTDRAGQVVSREMMEPGQNVRAWTTAYEQALAARLKAATERVDLAAQIRKEEQRLAALLREFDQAKAAQARAEYLAEVVVSCPAGQRRTVTLSYVVGGVRWSPSYEARLLDSGTELALSTYATLIQETGEDWRSAQLILSTAVPREDATPPEIAPLYVATAGKKPEERVVVSRTEEHRHAEAANALLPSGSTKSQSAGLPISSQGLSVQIHVESKAEVRGDGTPVRVLVGKSTMKAALKLRSVPKLLPAVFRVADLVNQAPYPLLPGTLDVFRRGHFLGRHTLDRIASGERFTLTFGIEEGVKVRRDVLEEAARDHGLLGPKKRRRYGYRFTVDNYLTNETKEPTLVEISEHIPVSEIEAIRVSIAQGTTLGFALAKEEGIVTYRLPLSKGERKVVDLRYHVEVPASYDAGD